MTLAFILAKHIHVWCVVLSYALFITRILWKSSNSSRLKNPFVKIAPHAIDSLLLATGVTMAIILDLELFSVNWFSLKMVLLISYIGVGTIAMKSQKFRKPLTAVATILFFNMIYLAINRPMM